MRFLLHFQERADNEMVRRYLPMALLLTLGCDPMENVSSAPVHFELSPSDGRGIVIPGATRSTAAKALVVASGSCSSCTRNPFIPGEEGQMWERVIILFIPDSQSVPERYKDLPARYRLVRHPGGVLHRKLHAELVPRFYQLGPDGAVLFADRGPTDRRHFLRSD